MSIEINPTGVALGAEIRGVDLDRPIDGETFNAIERAYNDHAVLLPRSRNHTNFTDTTLIASPGWTNWSREPEEFITCYWLSARIWTKGHYAAFILDLDGNNIEAVYRESKTA